MWSVFIVWDEESHHTSNVQWHRYYEFTTNTVCGCFHNYAPAGHARHSLEQRHYVVILFVMLSWILLCAIIGLRIGMLRSHAGHDGHRPACWLCGQVHSCATMDCEPISMQKWNSLQGRQVHYTDAAAWAQNRQNRGRGMEGREQNARKVRYIGFREMYASVQHFVCVVRLCLYVSRCRVKSLLRLGSSRQVPAMLYLKAHRCSVPWILNFLLNRYVVCSAVCTSCDISCLIHQMLTCCICFLLEPELFFYMDWLNN